MLTSRHGWLGTESSDEVWDEFSDPRTRPGKAFADLDI